MLERRLGAHFGRCPARTPYVHGECAVHLQAADPKQRQIAHMVNVRVADEHLVKVFHGDLHRHVAVAVTEIDGDAQISDVVKGQDRRRDPEACAAFTAAHPLDDVVDIEDQIVAPIALAGVADIEAQPIDDVVVPRNTVEIEFGNRIVHDRNHSPASP